MAVIGLFGYDLRCFIRSRTVQEFGELMSTASRPGARDWTAGLVLGWHDHRRQRVPGRALSRILDELGIERADLLSLNVEGQEAEALAGLDLARHAPTWILIEMHDLEAGRASIGRLLGELYVEHAQLSQLDVLYRRCDQRR
jgi:hypothetical protein